MKKVFYYAPFFRTIAKNSERLGVNFVSKMWEENGDFKAEVEVYGQTVKDAKEKFEKTMSSTDKTELVELEMDYYLCSQSVVDALKPQLISKAIKWDKENTYIAWINFEEAEEYEKANPETELFWCWQLTEGLMSVDNISFRRLKRENFYDVVYNEFNLSKEKNMAHVAFNISQREGVTPVELFNSIKS